MGQQIIGPLIPGTDRRWTITFRDSSGNPVAYSALDTLTASVWAGGSQPVLFSPTITWVDAPSGTATLSISAAQSTTLPPGRYSITVNIVTSSGGLTLTGWQGFLDIANAPGAEASLTSYCSYQDLLNYAPWLQKEQSDDDLAGFARERNLARQWLEEIIQRKYRLSGQVTFGNLFVYFPSYVPNGYDKTLQGWLDSNYLMVRPLVKQITAYRTIGMICMGAVGPGSEEASQYQRFGQYYLSESEELVKTFTAEIDINGDGVPDQFVACGFASARP